ncbi:uroporphyrinogen-III C-methyltransferase [Allorhizobium sp. BGMRC 0089]|uniref:uroporphyrinogen-III C-methyltransferase n=1 Tax=Allorhizobium sonneratiae TaxID=2934936 RepID=UPI0020338F3C|nr:uroporphyrinogen-III C-methyltransferase [Allorhizobium sonneratiae]MCM2293582.1 uroporphyrinogen-III C-methyltransferase [Allorhizobium sonneratiae]
MDDALFATLPDLLPGHVWLAGSGPGDPGLMTLLALKGLRQADVVVHDALVDTGCLAYARSDALIEHAGKRGGKPSPKQRDISLRLVELAKAGKRVLRLKGGDPFVFGRGGEEALTLVEHAIPFRIVPGISAGIGGLAYAGIPVTHREINHAVTFLTGHDSSGSVPDRIDWAAIAKGSPVIVLYMAMKHIGHIARQLLAAGRAADEPLAFVCHAATARQQVVETTLGEAEAAMIEARLEPPAMIVIGAVVGLRPSLDWLGALAGRNLLPDPFAADQERGKP